MEGLFFYPDEQKQLFPTSPIVIKFASKGFHTRAHYNVRSCDSIKTELAQR